MYACFLVPRASFFSAVDCLTQSLNVGAAYLSSSADVPLGTTVTFRCPTGHHLRPGRASATCSLNGRFDAIHPGCLGRNAGIKTWVSSAYIPSNICLKLITVTYLARQNPEGQCQLDLMVCDLRCVAMSLYLCTLFVALNTSYLRFSSNALLRESMIRNVPHTIHSLDKPHVRHEVEKRNSLSVSSDCCCLLLVSTFSGSLRHLARPAWHKLLHQISCRRGICRYFVLTWPGGACRYAISGVM